MIRFGYITNSINLAPRQRVTDSTNVRQDELTKVTNLKILVIAVMNARIGLHF